MFGKISTELAHILKKRQTRTAGVNMFNLYLSMFKVLRILRKIQRHSDETTSLKQSTVDLGLSSALDDK